MKPPSYREANSCQNCHYCGKVFSMAPPCTKYGQRIDLDYTCDSWQKPLDKELEES